MKRWHFGSWHFLLKGRGCACYMFISLLRGTKKKKVSMTNWMLSCKACWKCSNHKKGRDLIIIQMCGEHISRQAPNQKWLRVEEKKNGATILTSKHVSMTLRLLVFESYRLSDLWGFSGSVFLQPLVKLWSDHVLSRLLHRVQIKSLWLHYVLHNGTFLKALIYSRNFKDTVDVNFKCLKQLMV